MAAKRNGRPRPKSIGRQRSLFGQDPPSIARVTRAELACDVVAIEKRRDGKMRYWCRAHRADATAKYGKPAQRCRLADVPPVQSEEIQVLDLDKYLGGVALWGAAPAVYDTTRLPIERGIHVHARPTPKSEKEIDFTFQAVRIVGKNLPKNGIVIDRVDALYNLISTVFGFSTKYVTCTHCDWPHLDKDWFSVHLHRRHLCSGCGRHFHDNARGIGNPIVGIRDACGVAEHKIVTAPKKLNIKQAEFPGGIQIWGSNPAFLWTQKKHEEEGIHVHAYRTENQAEPSLDETYGEVVIDDVPLDPGMVRILMVQRVLPLLKDRLQSAKCSNCGHDHFDVNEAAYTPSLTHTCSECGNQFATSGRMRKTVVNPLPAILAELAKIAPRAPQKHRPELLSEIL